MTYYVSPPSICPQAGCKKPATHERLCELTDYSPTASTMGVILSKLRKLGLVESGRRRLAPEFMEAVGV